MTKTTNISELIFPGSRLTPVRPTSERRWGQIVWECLCQCGKIVFVVSRDLKDGHTRSCGCLNQELRAERKRTHGKSDSITYISWREMWKRCTNEGYDKYPYYGGRGIRVCDEWRSFEVFYMDMGDRPSKSHSLDRKEVNGHYCKGNCRWATKVEQMNNKSDNVVLDYGGKTMTVAQWSRELGIHHATIRTRLSMGWSVEKSLTQPVRSWA